MYDMDAVLNSRLNKMEEKVLKSHAGLMTSLLHVISLAINAHRLKRKVMNLVSESVDKNDEEKTLPDRKAVAHSVNRYTLALRKTAAFRVYERLFSLWHIIHVPFFCMMVVSAIVHVVAVHMY